MSHPKARGASLAVLLAAVLAANAARSQSGGQAKATDEERRLAEASKKAILQTGFSEPYFRQHFQLGEVVDKPGDRRVIWRFSIGDYETMVSDAIGFYTSAAGGRVDTHSVTAALGPTQDIQRVIPRKQADMIMRKCIGKFGSATVELLPSGGRAGLFLRAGAAEPRKNPAEAEEREKDRRKNAAKRSQTKGAAGIDEIENEEPPKRQPPPPWGLVDLETGQCTRGKAIATPYAP